MTAHAWLCRNNMTFEIPYSGRLARIVSVLDWETPNGKAILEARSRSGKWGELSTEDFKYLIEVYLPELTGKAGGMEVVTVLVPSQGPTVMTKAFQGTPLFHKMEDDSLNRIFSKQLLELYRNVVDHASIPGETPSEGGEQPN